MHHYRGTDSPSQPPLPLVTVAMEDASATGGDSDVENMEELPTTTRLAPKGGDSLVVRSSSAPGMAAEIVFAACMGSLLDLDHFFAAGSLRLSNATGLVGRPWGHCVMALFVVVRRGGWLAPSRNTDCAQQQRLTL